MKRDKLKELVKNIKNEIPTELDDLKEKYDYLFREKSFKDNFKLKRTKEVVKNIIKSSPIHSKNILLNLLDEDDEDDITVIGITGSVGKTSVAYLLHKYLEACGEKVTLLSSAGLSNPMSKLDKNLCMAKPIRSNSFLKSFIQSSIEYNSKYVIVEVPEEAIRDGLVDDIPFDIKVLTQFWKNWKGNSNEEKYFNTKSKFFKQEDDVMYFLNVSSQLLERFIPLTKHYKLYGTHYNANGISKDKIDYAIHKRFQSFTEQYFEILVGDKICSCSSNNLYASFSAINLAGIIGILEYLGVYNSDTMTEVLKSTSVPGREMIIANGRYIIISLNYTNEISFINDIQEGIHDTMFDLWKEEDGINHKPYINKIKILDGLVGYKSTWTDIGSFTNEADFLAYIHSDDFKYKHYENKAFEIFDEVYITNTNPGEADKQLLVDTYEDWYNQSGKPIHKIIDRKEAIATMIKESEPGDVLFISGRASYNLYEDGENILVFEDKDIVNRVLEELEWL